MLDLSSTNHQWEESLLSSFLNIVRAPDGDFAAIGQLMRATSDSESLQLLVKQLSRHPRGRQAFESRPSLGSVDLEELRALPEDTFGRLYAEHMLHNQLKPLQAQPAESDDGFLKLHITETHDVWHVVTGCSTDIVGEIQLEAFYVAQLEVSRFWLALLTKNLLKSVVYDIERSTEYMDAISKGWLMGRKAELLFGVSWNTLWKTPLEEVRAALKIVTL